MRTAVHCLWYKSIVLGLCRRTTHGAILDKTPYQAWSYLITPFEAGLREDYFAILTCEVVFRGAALKGSEQAGLWMKKVLDIANRSQILQSHPQLLLCAINTRRGIIFPSQDTINIITTIEYLRIICRGEWDEAGAYCNFYVSARERFTMPVKKNQVHIETEIEARFIHNLKNSKAKIIYTQTSIFPFTKRPLALWSEKNHDLSTK